MRSARDPRRCWVQTHPFCRALGEALRTIWLNLSHDAVLTLRIGNTAHVCACALLKILPLMQAPSGGPDGVVVPHHCVCVHVCFIWGDFAWKRSLHTLHCNAWAAAMLPELIQSLGHVHFLQHLKHIIEGGGANSFALINHRKKSPCRKGYTFLNGSFLFILVGFFPPRPLIYSSSIGSWVLRSCWFIEGWQLLTVFYKY